jgi:hypothetical protein
VNKGIDKGSQLYFGKGRWATLIMAIPLTTCSAAVLETDHACMGSKRGYNFDQFLLPTKANHNAHKQFGLIIYFKLALVFSICEN